MKKQVIQNFLNLPGIVGLALMDGYSHPYFCGIDQSLNFQQKDALTQGIQQVISTTPSGFESFEFRFAKCDARIYKLDSELILLVVTDQALDSLTYQDAVADLKKTLQAEDPQSIVSTFRLLAANTALSKQSYLANGQPTPETQPPETTETSPEINNLTSDSTAADTVTPVSSPPALTAPELVAEVTYRWDQGISALNTLTDATAQYLGRIIVANTWRATCPEEKVLDSLKLDRSGHFSYSPGANADRGQSISPEEHEILHHWVGQFIQRCSLIIRDYPEMVLHQTLDEQQRALLRIEMTD
ncbi:MAG: hypothetical protein F6K42_01290 [Leptolyngbya sp. SIO1D8]|nr:hypothetical protein [Leptolyngbya sp. SIO1D8]